MAGGSSPSLPPNLRVHRVPTTSRSSPTRSSRMGLPQNFKVAESTEHAHSAETHRRFMGGSTDTITASSRLELVNKVDKAVKSWRRKRMYVDSEVKFIERTEAETMVENWSKLPSDQRPMLFGAYEDALRDREWTWIAVYHVHS
jgi:hypothetical protein